MNDFDRIGFVVTCVLASTLAGCMTTDGPSVASGAVAGLSPVLVRSPPPTATVANCYMDRSPGGCWEQKMERDRLHKQHDEFIALMRSVPNSDLPVFCRVRLEPWNEYVTEENLTPGQMKTCTDTANAWQKQAQQKQQQVQQRRQQDEIDYIKGISSWQRIEAGNGAVYRIDTAHIRHETMEHAEVNVYAVEGEMFDPRNLKTLIFDCRGHFMDTSVFGVTSYAPPRSIAGMISSIACATPVK